MFFESLKEEYFKLVEVRKEALFIGDHDKIKNTESRDISKYRISKSGYLYLDCTQISVVDAIDVRPAGYYGSSITGQFWTYGQLKWVDYSEFEHKFNL